MNGSIPFNPFEPGELRALVADHWTRNGQVRLTHYPRDRVIKLMRQRVNSRNAKGSGNRAQRRLIGLWLERRDRAILGALVELRRHHGCE